MDNGRVPTRWTNILETAKTDSAADTEPAELGFNKKLELDEAETKVELG